MIPVGSQRAHEPHPLPLRPVLAVLRRLHRSRSGAARGGPGGVSPPGARHLHARSRPLVRRLVRSGHALRRRGLRLCPLALERRSPIRLHPRLECGKDGRANHARVPDRLRGRVVPLGGQPLRLRTDLPLLRRPQPPPAPRAVLRHPGRARLSWRIHRRRRGPHSLSVGRDAAGALPGLHRDKTTLHRR